MKKIKILASILIVILTLSACSKTVLDDKKIREDINTGTIAYISEKETVDKTDITAKEMTENEKMQIVGCRVESHDEEVAYIRYLTLNYQLYDKEGWVLTDYNWTNYHKNKPI